MIEAKVYGSHISSGYGQGTPRLKIDTNVLSKLEVQKTKRFIQKQLKKQKTYTTACQVAM